MSNRSAAFRERLRVPFRWWLQGGLLVASFWVAMIVALPEAAAWGIAAAMMAMLAAALRSYGGARIVVEGGWLHAGRAKIELKFVGPIRALDPTATRALWGPLADARAFLLLRPYLPRAVRIDIDDPDDPTPYWLVSSRRPASLVAALHQTRQGTVDGETGIHAGGEIRRLGQEFRTRCAATTSHSASQPAGS